MGNDFDGADGQSNKPRLTAAQFAAAIEQGKAWAAEMRASVGEGHGDFTKERHELPERSNEEIVADMMRIQEADMKAGEIFI